MEPHTSLVDPAAPPAAPKRPRGRPRKIRSEPAGPPAITEVAFERDLCTCTYDEIQARWSPAKREFIEKLRGRSWDELVPPEHQFIYYLATKVWFDNPRANAPAGHKEWRCFLYAPLHRDKYLRPITSYLIDPAPTDDGVLCLGPRDTYKSTLLAAIMQAHILREKHLHDIDVRDVISHHKFTLAWRSVKRVAAKFRYHPYMRRFWEEYCPPLDVRQWESQNDGFTLPNAGFLGEQGESTLRAVGGTASDTGSHVDLRGNDDLVTEDHQTSKAVRDEAKAKYEAAQFQRDTISGKEINIGTPYHVNDLWAAMIKSNVEGEARYKIIRVPGIAETCGRCGHTLLEHPEVVGTPLELAPCAVAGCACREADIFAHPYRLTKAFLEKKMQSELSRTGRIVLWYLQYQCQGKSSFQTAADLEWLRWDSQANIPADAWPVICVDPAWKGTDNQGEGDSASIQVWFLERRGGMIYRWLADGTHSNEMDSGEGIKNILRLMEQYDVSAAAPEQRGGYGFGTTLQNAGNEKGIPIEIIKLKMARTEFDQRITAWLREMQCGRVIVCRECNPDLLDALKDQIKDYPQLDHDDAIDAAAYSCDPAIAEAWAPRFRRPTRRFAPKPEREFQLTRHCAY